MSKRLRSIKTGVVFGYSKIMANTGLYVTIDQNDAPVITSPAPKPKKAKKKAKTVVEKPAVSDDVSALVDGLGGNDGDNSSGSD